MAESKHSTERSLSSIPGISAVPFSTSVAIEPIVPVGSRVATAQQIND
ncbi:MAG: hypothetical protein KME42_14515 [Tildeniella nuda ZEHNDER 1965/U140]|nr:hypothetical protein [Tildeniella nuda ZEHNDER 1965/U140]